MADKLLGDAFVLAYRPNPPGKTDQEQGLFLLRARDADTLAGFVERLNRAQKESGDLKEIEDAATRAPLTSAGGEGETFYHVNGPVLAYSSQEAMLRQAIERDREAYCRAAVASQLRLLGADRRWRACGSTPPSTPRWHTTWSRPRVLTRSCSALPALLEGPRRGRPGAGLGEGRAADPHPAGAHRRIAPAAKRLLSEAARPSDVWDRFPKDALLTVAGRLDPGLAAGGVGRLPDEGQRGCAGPALDQTFWPARRARTSWGRCCCARPRLRPVSAGPGEHGQGPRAAGIAGGLCVRPDKGADEAVLSAVDFYARLAAVAYGNQGKVIGLKSLRQDKTEVKYLARRGAFPPGVQPAYGAEGRLPDIRVVAGGGVPLRQPAAGARRPARCRCYGCRHGGCTTT